MTELWEYIRSISDRFHECVEGNFMTIFEAKHLYQNHVVPVAQLADHIRSKELVLYHPDVRTPSEAEIDSLLKASWTPLVGPPRVSPGAGRSDPLKRLFRPPSVRLYCPRCKKREPHHPVTGEDLYSSRRWSYDQHSKRPEQYQLYFITYQCQGCLTDEVAFSVKRVAWKLTICGRDPMEQVEVPQFIPRESMKHYSDALIAFNSGQVLPALFMIRVFIEQHCNAVLYRDDLRADVAVDTYMKALPADFKSRFPSLRKIYEELSVALHTATPSEELFNSSVDAIDRHFDALRLF